MLPADRSEPTNPKAEIADEIAPLANASGDAVDRDLGAEQGATRPSAGEVELVPSREIVQFYPRCSSPKYNLWLELRSGDLAGVVCLAVHVTA
jgi:hypothetical protein